jgi:hypothetical protein
LCALSPKTGVIVMTARDDLAVRATAMRIGSFAFFSNRLTMKNFSRRCTMRSLRLRSRNHPRPKVIEVPTFEERAAAAE